MSLSNLSTAEMIGLSAPWLDPARHRKTLTTSPRISHFVPDLEKAHEGLLALGDVSPATSPGLVDLQAREAAIDSTHDRKARGASKLLAALAELADTDEQRQSLTTLGAVLFPQGLGFLNTSYAAEAGNVESTERRLTAAPDAQSLLKKTRLPWGDTLLDEVNAWFAAGHELGKLEAERTALTGPVSRPSSGNSKARGRWLSVMATLLSSVSLDDEPSAEVQAHVLTPLSEATARADARTARRKASKEEATDQEGSSPAGGQGGSSPAPT